MVKSQIKQKFQWLNAEEIDTCFNMALHDFIRLSYPSKNNRPNISNIDLDFYDAQFVYERMLDILDRAGGSSVVSYKENGIQWTYAQSFIDPRLSAMIIPKAGVPR